MPAPPHSAAGPLLCRHKGPHGSQLLLWSLVRLTEHHCGQQAGTLMQFELHEPWLLWEHLMSAWP